MYCKHCGNEVVPSGDASVCPLCGNPLDGEGGRVREAIPWEARRSLVDFDAIVETVKKVLLEPTDTFGRMKTGGDMGSPLLFAMMLGTFSTLVGLFWQWAIQHMGFLGNEALMKEMIMTTTLLVVIVILSPLFVAISLFIYAGILHLCLLLVGGAAKGFEATFRTVAYAGGSTSLFQLIPVCGSLVGGVWNLVLVVIGLKEMHEISTGKALAAVLLPLIACCACGALLMVFFGAALLAALSQHG